MGIDVTVTIGGAAGQGIQTVGDLMAQTCRLAGLYVMAVNDFESRIRGGHSFMQIRVSDKPVNAPRRPIHLLVALNKETYSLHQSEIAENGIILMDQQEPGKEKNVISVPFTQIAKESGGKIMANTVAAGACLSLLGEPSFRLEQVLKRRFAKQNSELLNNNINAARKGYEAVKGIDYKWRFDWPSQSPQGKLLSGSQALALGILSADCRLAFFYPMSPATDVMVHLAGFSTNLPIVVEQAEDEISAINMVIGASFAGVRSVTATSGGGFSLMTEGLGLAGITETPVVIINAQRPGPATGLPTRTAQGDLHFVIHAAQDEFPRFVLAPHSVNHGFDTVIRAFDLADKYQVPVILLVDQYFNDSLWITDRELAVPKQINRHIVRDEDMDDPAGYKRFLLTESGISPRALPCQGKALVAVAADEHSEDGHMSEAASDRNHMVNKRQRKMQKMLDEMNGPQTYHGDSRTLLVGWGSTFGIVREAVDLLRSDGFDVGAAHFSDIWPFPADKVHDALAKCERFFMVEQNFSSQMGVLIRQQTGLLFEQAILKYDGRPILPDDIARRAKTFLEA